MAAALNRGRDNLWVLKTPPGTSDFTMHVDEKDGRKILVCTVGNPDRQLRLQGPVWGARSWKQTRAERGDLTQFAPSGSRNPRPVQPDSRRGSSRVVP